ncbi:hypothetical protein [Desulfocapsa sulfexigens]|uniref:hypothetical protein n=1 Tax=Desulfocapsa sulfexigens TaxID=65555 RepID=UPI000345C6C9|nr:hypothetical protein [Desulfocapsa sulfexigens]
MVTISPILVFAPFLVKEIMPIFVCLNKEEVTILLVEKCQGRPSAGKPWLCFGNRKDRNQV